MSPTATSQEQSVEERNAAACPIVEAVEQIGSEWRLIVLHDLVDSEQRFNELKRSTGASSRTLSRVLDDLEDANLVDRRVEDRPIATYYSLTEKGQALCPIFTDLEEWADEWVDGIEG
ncbi:transcriptional regulator [Halorhabdus sp. CBA1104]|uniref:winged helix-turn-helix transcriptional regulator n=1 Tax=unclassified Halorhabdus TaxID=2621901 RepID=UPI0012B1CD7C|nr:MULTISPECIES: helix-turn-helix domain-containing protein [unclassified Halorhabdus]QGN07062.1 transcriptional regulator [Halorhabdus sp. CBA1104]